MSDLDTSWTSNRRDNEPDGGLALADYLHIARQRKWLIVSVAVAVTLLGWIYSIVQTPQYRASALVRLDLDPASLVDNSDTRWLDSRRAIENELRELNTTLMWRSVSDRLGYEAELSATNDGGSDIMKLTAVGSDQDAVARDANVFAETYIELQAERSAQKFVGTGQRISELIEDIDGRLAQLGTSDVEETERNRLSRQRSYYEEQLDTLQLSADVTQGIGARLISPAERPKGSFAPRVGRTIAFAALVGLALGAGLAFVRELLDTRVRSRDDLSRIIGTLPVLATVPAQRGGNADREVATMDTPQSVVSEAYRTLRTGLQFAGLQSAANRILMASSDPAAGKTTTAVNLATVFAQQGRKVVLIDADLRSPRTHEHFGISNGKGLTGVISGEIDIEDALQPLPDVPGLSVLTSGAIPPNPTELLGATVFPGAAKSMPEILDSLEQDGYLVIVDTAPVLPVADALLLSSYVDGVVMVVRAGNSLAPNVAGALDALDRAGAKVFGVLFNGATSSDGGYGYGYGYGYGDASGPEPTWLDRLFHRVPKATPVAASVVASPTASAATDKKADEVEVDTKPRNRPPAKKNPPAKRKTSAKSSTRSSGDGTADAAEPAASPFGKNKSDDTKRRKSPAASTPKA